MTIEARNCLGISASKPCHNFDTRGGILPNFWCQLGGIKLNWEE